jgi:hypothetical protein
MAPMGLRVALVAVMGVLATGCGTSDQPLPTACARGESPLASALHAAPDRVALDQGARLSDCVSRADGATELQEFATGATLLADHLAVRAGQDDTAAVELGYLIGAVRRGARHTSGVHAELVRRLERAAQPVPASRRAALNRGLAAGERSG